MDWDKVRIFHAVAEAGSFTHAGEALNLSQSAVSRQISALEESLKTTLFHRHARGLVLTEQGDLLYGTAHEVFDRLALVESMLTDSKEKPRGELRISTTVGLGAIWLAPRIREFLDLYPEITINLIVSDVELDLSVREADVAIRMRQPTQPDLVQRRLMTVHFHICASPDYIRRHGAPERPEDLSDHRIIVYGDRAPATVRNVNWLASFGAPRNRPRRPVMKVNSVHGLLLAVESGLGIAALPDYIVQGKSDLVRVLTSVEGPSFDTYFVYPEELRNSKRITTFRDFLIEQVSQTPF